jgi:hypothetical protein
MHPIHRPLGPLALLWSSQLGDDSSAWRLQPHLQALQAIQPMHALDDLLRSSMQSTPGFIGYLLVGREAALASSATAQLATTAGTPPLGLASTTIDPSDGLQVDVHECPTSSS